MTGGRSKELFLVFCALHFLHSHVHLVNAPIRAHLFHCLDVADLEVDQALVEALDLALDHKASHGVLVVRSGGVDEIS